MHARLPRRGWSHVQLITHTSQRLQSRARTGAPVFSADHTSAYRARPVAYVCPADRNCLQSIHDQLLHVRRLVQEGCVGSCRHPAASLRSLFFEKCVALIDVWVEKLEHLLMNCGWVYLFVCFCVCVGGGGSSLECPTNCFGSSSAVVYWLRWRVAHVFCG